MLFKSQESTARKIRHLISVHVESEAKIRPHCIVTGPTGSGKTFLVTQEAKAAEVPCFELNAAQLTAEGLSGNSLSKALRPLKANWDRPNIVIVDEFDKLFQRNGSDAEGFRSDVQDEFLHILESGEASVFGEYGKYDQVPVKNSLFIFAGAFNNQKAGTPQELQKLGMRPEFVGRVPLVIAADQIPLEELIAAIPHVELFRNYSHLQGLTKKQEAKAAAAIEAELVAQFKQCALGVRAINAAVHTHFMGEGLK